MKLLFKPTILCVALVAAMPASAADNLRFSGFGTVGATHSDNDQANFVPNHILQPNSAGAGLDNTISYSTDTKFGVQMDYQATSNLSLTLQAVSRYSPRSSWTPDIKWAFAKYKATPSLDVRVGRIRPSIYQLSDYLDVNYANPWLRPPTSVYSLTPLTRMEGIDLIWRPSSGDVNFTVQPFIGYSKIDATNDRTLEGKNLLGIILNTEIGQWNVRFSHVGTDLTVHSPDFEHAVRPLLNNPALIPLPGGGTLGTALGAASLPAATQVLNDLSPDNKYSTFTSMGFSWDNGDWLVSGEYAVRRLELSDPDATGWYISAARRIGKWTPFVVYSDLAIDSSASYTIASYDTGRGAVANAIANQALSGVGTNIVRGNATGQSVWSLGTRYDLAKGVALKAQWDIYKTKEADGRKGFYRGLFIGATPSFTAKSQTVNILSVSADFVF